VGVLVAQLATVVALRRLADRPGFTFDPAGWVRGAPPEDAVGGALAAVALVAASWLLASTLAYTITSALGWTRASASLGRVTVPGLRRLVDGALVLSVAATVLTPAGAGAGLGPPAPTVPPASVATRAPVPASAYDVVPAASAVRDGRGAPSAPAAPDPHLAPTPPGADRRSAPTDPPSVAAPDPQPTPAPPAADRPTGSPDPGPSDASRIVASGDDLWHLAAAHLAATTGRARDALTLEEIVAYWRLVCDDNRPRLRSGDPNLVFVGEEVVLRSPAVGAPTDPAGN
jgi:hypothetical protein